MKAWFPVLGVIIAQFVLVALYFLKQRSDDKRRWHEKRLDAYRALSKAARTTYEVLVMAEQVEDLDDRRLVVAMNDADACLLDIALLSSPEVRETAELLATFVEMAVVIDATTAAYPNHADLLSARYDFERAVRAELGVKDSNRLSRSDRDLLKPVEAARESEDGQS